MCSMNPDSYCDCSNFPEHLLCVRHDAESWKCLVMFSPSQRSYERRAAPILQGRLVRLRGLRGRAAKQWGCHPLTAESPADVPGSEAGKYHGGLSHSPERCIPALQSPGRGHLPNPAHSGSTPSPPAAPSRSSSVTSCWLPRAPTALLPPSTSRQIKQTCTS